MSSPEEIFYRSADGITKIRALKWAPDVGTKPVALLQIVHGMQEFIDRYDAFARFMASKGFIVFGNDILGHGGSIRNGDERYFGYFGRGVCPGDGTGGSAKPAGAAQDSGTKTGAGTKTGTGTESDAGVETNYAGTPYQDARTGGHRILLSDIRALQDLMADRYPDLPCFLLGHSMGSFLAREFLCVHGGSLRGAVISGTAYHPAAETVVGRSLAVILGQTRGWFYRSPLLNKLSVGNLNKEFEPARTPVDWLTRDEAIVDRYVADRRTQFKFTCNAYYALFDCLHYLTVADNLRHMPKNLPVMLIAGAQDPVGADGAGPTRVAAQLKGIGMKHVITKIYPQGRHEVLNELNRAEVWDDVLSFLQAAMPGREN